jgi:hypothetical protein
MKKTVIVDVIVVKSAMWAEGWERGERDKSQRVEQLLSDRGPEWIGIRHYEQETGPPGKSGFLIILQGVETITCTLCRYRLIVRCVNKNEILMCRSKINHAWS